jgi:hypothetical protein
MKLFFLLDASNYIKSNLRYFDQLGQMTLPCSRETPQNNYNLRRKKTTVIRFFLRITKKPMIFHANEIKV